MGLFLVATKRSKQLDALIVWQRVFGVVGNDQSRRLDLGDVEDGRVLDIEIARLLQRFTNATLRLPIAELPWQL